MDKGVDKMFSGLTILLDNISPTAFDVQVTVEFSGLINKIQSIDLGKYRMEVNGSKDLYIPALDFPVQCPSGACQVYANALITYDNDIQGSSHIVPSLPIYYRHAPDYSKVALFTEKALIKDLGGKVCGHGVNKSLKKGDFLGRVKKDKDTFNDVRFMSDEFATIINGQVVGYVTGSDISIDKGNLGGKL